MRELRQFRRRMMVRIAWAQARWSAKKSSLQQLSALAETLIVAARDWLTPPAVKSGARRAMPKAAAAAADPRDGQAGRRRAEFSSDIDLILPGRSNGTARRPPRAG
jgi:glutamate-ammonia-ligase adenylyltransferase